MSFGYRDETRYPRVLTALTMQGALLEAVNILLLEDISRNKLLTACVTHYDDRDGYEVKSVMVAIRVALVINNLLIKYLY